MNFIRYSQYCLKKFHCLYHHDKKFKEKSNIIILIFDVAIYLSALFCLNQLCSVWFLIFWILKLDPYFSFYKSSKNAKHQRPIMATHDQENGQHDIICKISVLVNLCKLRKFKRVYVDHDYKFAHCSKGET